MATIANMSAHTLTVDTIRDLLLQQVQRLAPDHLQEFQDIISSFNFRTGDPAALIDLINSWTTHSRNL